MKKKNQVWLLNGLLAAGIAAMALTGCGSAKEAAPQTQEQAKTQEQAQTEQQAQEQSPQETKAEDAGKIYRTLEEIQKSGTVNIGVFSDKNPFGYVDENGVYQGYDVYFAERIGKDLGVEINYVSTEAANRVEYLETGKVDIILANFTVTEERAEKVDFALPYMNVALGVVSPEDRVITDLSQITADDQVIVISGTTAETYLEKNNPEIRLQKFDTYASAKTSFENGTGEKNNPTNKEWWQSIFEHNCYILSFEEMTNERDIANTVSRGLYIVARAFLSFFLASFMFMPVTLGTILYFLSK